MYFFSSTVGVVPDAFRPGEYYTISIQCDSSDVLFRVYVSDSATEVGNVYYTAVKGSPKTFTISDTTKTLFFSLLVNTGKTIDCDVRCQIEYGKTVTEWETPVDNAYTTQLGNTYYGGSLDVATGVMTVNVAIKIFDGTESWILSEPVGDFAVLYNSSSLYPNRTIPRQAVCTHFNFTTDMTSAEAGFGIFETSYGGFFKYPNSSTTASEFKAFIASQYANGTPVTVCYNVEPFTIQLTPTQIKSLPALDKYKPRINTAYTDQEAVQVGYQRYHDESNSITGKANDSEVVHKAGEETITGVKLFQNNNTASDSSIFVKSSSIVKGTPTVSDKSAGVCFADSTSNNPNTTGRLASVVYHSPTSENSEYYVHLRCNDYYGAGDSILRVGYDGDNVPYATAPETSDNRDDSADIITRGYMDASEWNWQKSKKAGAVTFKPVPESDLEPVVDFIFTETPPAEGNKGPENPSTITGVSSINLIRTNTNLLLKNPAESKNFASIAFTCNGDGSYTANGTANGGFSTRDTVGSFRWNLRNLPNGTYILKFKEGLPAIKIGATITRGGTTGYPGFASETNTIHLYEDTTYYMLYFYGAEGTSYSNATTHPYLVMEGTDTVFEVPQDDTYAISLGNTYYGGSLDVATGVMTVTYEVHEFSGSTAINNIDQRDNGLTTFGFRFTSQIQDITTVNNSSACTHFLQTSDYTSGVDGYHFSKIRLYIDSTTIHTEADFSAWLADQKTAGTPVTVVFPLETPFTVQLTPAQIRSLPALDKYEPRINTVYTDQEAVRVGYQRCAGNTFYNTLRIFKSVESIDGTVNDCIRGKMGYDDVWRIGAGATALDSGFLEIATGDNGTEPIYVSQYYGGNVDFTALRRRVTLLDSAGNSVFPGHITSEVGYRAVNKDNVVISANDLYVDLAGVVSTYYTSSNSNTKITDVPTNVSLMLESKTVRRPTASDYHIKQFCYAANSDISYRYCSNGTWSAWKQFAFVQDVVTLATNQEITGTKYFTYGPIAKSTSIDVTNDSTTQDFWRSFWFCDKNNQDIVTQSIHYAADRSFSLRMYDKSGSQYWIMFWSLAHDGSNHYVTCGGDFKPTSPNNYTLGTASYKWKEIWCTQSSINSSSDERIKSNIKLIPDNVLDAWENVNWIEFQYNDAISEKGENARLHTGLIAQRVASAFKQADVQIDKYGFYLYDKWDSEEASFDENGKEVRPAIKAGDAYGIRYTEALCMEAAYQRRRAERAEKRISDLENNFKELMKEFINMKNEFDEMKRQMK